MAARSTNTDSTETQQATPLSADDAIRALTTSRLGAVSITEEEKDDRGFIRVYDKEKLVGVGFTIVDWSEELTDYGVAVAVRLVTRSKKALYFTDSGAGIREQLRKVATEKGVTQMIVCPKGLTVSRYTYEGQSVKTFYIDTSA